MRKRTKWILISTGLSILVLTVLLLSFSMTEGSIPADGEIVSASDKLVVDSMMILDKYPAAAFSIKEGEWPESIRALSPLSLWVNKEGLYIVTKKRYVESWGIFIPREDSEKFLEQKGMPIHNRVIKGIYKFYAD